MIEIEKFTKENLRLRNKLDFTPDAANAEWDDIEIEKCYEDDDAVEPIRGDDETIPDFWSVYLHQVTGGVQCIADLPTEKLANEFGELIRNAVRSFKENGYLAMFTNKELQNRFNQYLDNQIQNNAWNDSQRVAYENIKHEFNKIVW